VKPHPLLVNLILAGLLLAGCNLPTASRPAAPSEPAQAAASLPEATPGPTPEVARLLAPEDVGRETLGSADLQTEPPQGYRARLLVPVGGFSLPMDECPGGKTAPYFAQAALEVPLPTDPLFGTAFFICGWGVNEQVELTLTAPDGSQTSETLTASADGGVYYFFFTRYGMPFGAYTLELKGFSGSVSQTFQAVPASGPAMTEVDAATYYLTGYQAGEELLLVSYLSGKGQLALSAWKRSRADERGQLLLKIEVENSLTAVFAQGRPAQWSKPSLGTLIGSGYLKAEIAPCGSAPPSQLNPNSYALVTEGQPNNIRKQPSTDATVIGKADPGETLLVWDEAPVCDGARLWWKVSNLAGTLTGWTVEGAGGRYWLVPLE